MIPKEFRNRSAEAMGEKISERVWPSLPLDVVSVPTNPADGPATGFDAPPMLGSRAWSTPRSRGFGWCLIVSTFVHVCAAAALLANSLGSIGGSTEPFETLSVDIVLLDPVPAASPVAPSIPSSAQAASPAALETPVSMREAQPKQQRPPVAEAAARPDENPTKRAPTQDSLAATPTEADPQEASKSVETATRPRQSEATPAIAKEAIQPAKAPGEQVKVEPPAPPTMASVSSSAIVAQTAATAAATASPGALKAFARSVARALARTPPERLRGTGTVHVAFVVRVDGSVEDIMVRRSSGDRRIDVAALAAVRRAKLPRPPPGATRTQRSFVIPYFFKAR